MDAITLSEDDVRKIIDTSVKDISVYIKTAELIVNEQLLHSGMSEDRLKLIGIYLTAHFITTQDKQLTSETFGSASETYSLPKGLYLSSTTYGDRVKTLDTSGILSDPNDTSEIILML